MCAQRVAVRGDRGVHHVGTMGGSYTRDQRWALAGTPSWLKVKPHYRSHDTTNKPACDLCSSCGRQHVPCISLHINEHGAVHDYS